MPYVLPLAFSYVSFPLVFTQLSSARSEVKEARSRGEFPRAHGTGAEYSTTVVTTVVLYCIKLVLRRTQRETLGPGTRRPLTADALRDTQQRRSHGAAAAERSASRRPRDTWRPRCPVRC